MIPRFALALTTAFPLIVTIAPLGASATSWPAIGPAAVAGSYFQALDRGLRPHDFGELDHLYASGVTLTESLTNGQPRLHVGIDQVLAFDHANNLNWYVSASRQLSPTVMLTVERVTVSGPGHEAVRTGAWLTVFEIRSGKIVSLVWMPC
jgi:hypothetical protein